MKILGTNFFGHDSSIFLLDTKKKKIFSLSTERLTRIKHDFHDVSLLLKKYKNEIKGVKVVSNGYENYDELTNPYKLYTNRLYRKIRKPKYISDLFNKSFKNIFFQFAKSLFLQPVTFFKYFYYKLKYFQYDLKSYDQKIKNCDSLAKNFISKTLEKNNLIAELNYKNHHKCHAASAYFFSNFPSNEKTLSFTIDGYGDLVFSSIYGCKGKKIKLLDESAAQLVFIDGKRTYCSVGFIYTAFTIALNFTPFSDEGKVEALAAFGKVNNNLMKFLRSCVQIKDTKIILNEKKVKKIYNYNFLKRTVKKVGRENFAYCIQRWLEETTVNYLNNIQKKHKFKNLCLSGGVAANVIMNLKIFEKTNFKKIFIFPAMGDDGISSGAAILSALENKQDISWLKNIRMPYFGPEVTTNEIISCSKKYKNINTKKIKGKIEKIAAKSLANNKIIALVNGKIEYGPRALGNRSILANPFNSETRNKLNLEIKRRPGFQPFCPVILEEERKKFFSQSFQNNHMTIAFRMKKKYQKLFPSAIHIDGTARPQFVTKNVNYRLYKILKEFKKITGYGILINTSFNLHGRAMVLNAEDAYDDFADCNLDELYIGEFLAKKLNN